MTGGFLVEAYRALAHAQVDALAEEQLKAPALAPVPAPRLNHLGIRHGGRYPLAFFTHAEAMRRALWKADQTGIRHRVELCRVPPEAHYLTQAWVAPHYVVKPVEEARHV